MEKSKYPHRLRPFILRDCIAKKIFTPNKNQGFTQEDESPGFGGASNTNSNVSAPRGERKPFEETEDKSWYNMADHQDAWKSGGAVTDKIGGSLAQAWKWQSKLISSPFAVMQGNLDAKYLLTGGITGGNEDETLTDAWAGHAQAAMAVGGVAAMGGMSQSTRTPNVGVQAGNRLGGTGLSSSLVSAGGGIQSAAGAVQSTASNAVRSVGDRVSPAIQRGRAAIGTRASVPLENRVQNTSIGDTVVPTSMTQSRSMLSSADSRVLANARAGRSGADVSAALSNRSPVYATPVRTNPVPTSPLGSVTGSGHMRSGGPGTPMSTGNSATPMSQIMNSNGSMGSKAGSPFTPGSPNTPSPLRMTPGEGSMGGRLPSLAKGKESKWRAMTPEQFQNSKYAPPGTSFRARPSFSSPMSQTAARQQGMGGLGSMEMRASEALRNLSPQQIESLGNRLGDRLNRSPHRSPVQPTEMDTLRSALGKRRARISPHDGEIRLHKNNHIKNHGEIKLHKNPRR